jgi:hypothetical protein
MQAPLLKSLLWISLLALTFAPLSAAPAFAQDGEEASADADEDDEFSTTWFGFRGGFWYRPSIRMNAQVTGRGFVGGLANVLGSEIDIERDLAVRESPHSETSVDFDAEAVVELSPFVETRWVSVYGWVTAPFEYRGNTQLGRSLSFGGATFTASSNVRSKFRQLFFGTDVAVNIFNNRFFRVAPLVGLRAIGVDWEIRSRDTSGRTIAKGDTSDIKSPFQLGDFEILPHPEIGALLSVGYRDYVDVNLRLATAYVDYFQMVGATYRVELSVTAYPIPWVGIEVGARYLEYDIHSKAAQGRRGAFDFDLEFAGLTAAIIVRI